MAVELEQILKLPVTVERIVPADWLDENGHMNMMWYTGLGNMAFNRFFKALGVSYEEFRSRGHSTFALQQVLNYLSELRQGDKVEVHTGFAGYDAKRLHFFHYIVNATANKLACVDERLAIYIDMNTRRSTNFEPDIAARFEQAVAKFGSYGWTPEYSGAIKLKK